MQGKVFIVTGGASGLGEGTARMLAAEGGKVVIADMQADKGEAVAREIGGASSSATSARRPTARRWSPRPCRWAS
jgi:NAD(P)-dependent dehydrogenase (short-subunit alcohol dehydrogenase family)